MHILAIFWPESGIFGLFWHFFCIFTKFGLLPLANINFETSNLFQMNSTAFLSQKLKKSGKKNFKLRGKPWIFEKLRIFFNFLIFYLKCFKMRGWTLFWDILVKSYGKKCARPPNSAHCARNRRDIERNFFKILKKIAWLTVVSSVLFGRFL